MSERIEKFGPVSLNLLAREDNGMFTMLVMVMRLYMSRTWTIENSASV